MTRAELDDERAFLLRSIDDLDEELAAGDLSEDDHAVLRDRYVARAAAVLRALERDETDPSSGSTANGSTKAGAAAPADAPPAPQARPTRAQRRGALFVGVAVVVLAAVSVVVVVTQTGSRLPGDTSSGTVRMARGEQLRRTDAQADTLQSRGDVAGALRLYHQVLAADPTDYDALAQSGWLEFEAGVQARNGAVLAHAQRLEEQAVRADPGAYVAHLYLGSMLLAENDAVGAREQYRQFLSDHPPPAEVRMAAPFIDRAFAATGQPPPPLPEGTTPGR